MINYNYYKYIHCSYIFTNAACNAVFDLQTIRVPVLRTMVRKTLTMMIQKKAQKWQWIV